MNQTLILILLGLFNFIWATTFKRIIQKGIIFLLVICMCDNIFAHQLIRVVVRCGAQPYSW